MVFSGSSKDPGPYDENHPYSKEPEITWYGYSKAQGEINLQTETDNCAVVRIISPVRAHFEPKLDYFRKMLSLYDSNNLYPMFTDQWVSVTFIDELAGAITKLLLGKLTGIFHVASRDTKTPYKIASYLLEKARNAKGKVTKGKYSTVVKDNRRYPQHGGLISEATQKRLRMRFSAIFEIIDKLAPVLQ